MPEARLAKTRRSLPEGYQFGDAATRQPMRIDVRVWRSIDGVFHAKVRQDWNVIEGEPFDTDRDPGDETPTRRLRRREA